MSSRTDKTFAINLLVSFNSVSCVLVLIEERLELSVSLAFVSCGFLPQPAVLVFVVFVLKGKHLKNCAIGKHQEFFGGLFFKAGFALT